MGRVLQRPRWQRATSTVQDEVREWRRRTATDPAATEPDLRLQLVKSRRPDSIRWVHPRVQRDMGRRNEDGKGHRNLPSKALALRPRMDIGRFVACFLSQDDGGTDLNGTSFQGDERTPQSNRLYPEIRLREHESTVEYSQFIPSSVQDRRTGPL